MILKDINFVRMPFFQWVLCAMLICLLCFPAQSAYHVSDTAYEISSESDLPGAGSLGQDADSTRGPASRSQAAIWVEEARLFSSSVMDEDRFGAHVAIDEDTALIGAPGHGIFSNSPPGAAYIYTDNGSGWDEQAKLVSSDELIDDRFGVSVSLEGDTAVVGARGHIRSSGFTPGAAYVFVRDGTSWSQQAKLSAPDGSNGFDYFGSHVSISGDTIFVAAPGATVAGKVQQGAVYVFVRAGASWAYQAKLTASDGVANDLFGGGIPNRGELGGGKGLALASDTALIGAPFVNVNGNPGQGAVYVFTRTDGAWSEQTKLIASDGAVADGFGVSVALMGDMALIGAEGITAFGHPRPGAAYVFSRSGDVWNEQAKLTASDGAANNHFGTSVAFFSESVALVGAEGRNNGSDGVYVFSSAGGVWSESAKLKPAFARAVGRAISVGGNAVLTSAIHDLSVPRTLAYVLVNLDMPPAGHATVSGTVRSRYCSAEIIPLEGATVTISGFENDYELETRPDGFYWAFLPDNESPVDITVTAPDHFSEERLGVEFLEGELLELDFEPLMDAPCATTDPPAFSIELEPGQSTMETLNIGNLDGVAELSWEINAVSGVDAGHVPLAAVSSSQIGSRSESSDIQFDDSTGNVLDLVSELGTPLPGLSPVQPFAAVADCEDAPSIILHDDGTIENGYTGNPGAVNSIAFVDRFTPSTYRASFRAVCIAFLSQGSAALDFEIVVFADDGPDGSPGTELGALAVSADDLLIVPPILQSPSWFSYDISELDISIDSGSVYIGVRWATTDPPVFIAADQSSDRPPGFAGGYVWTDNTDSWNLIVRAANSSYRALFVRTVQTFDCDHSPAVSWLDFNPHTGLTQAGNSSEVSVTIDTAGLVAGVTYEAAVCISGNDPVNPALAVPVTLTVPIPAHFTTIEGTVEGLGYCGTDRGPVADTEVVLEGQDQTYMISADGNGFYQLPVDPGEGPVKLTVSAPGYISHVVDLDNLPPGETLIQDFNLVFDQPCVTVAPAELSLELPEDTTETFELTIGNLVGGSDLVWEIEMAEPVASDASLPDASDRDAEVMHRAASSGLGAEVAMDLTHLLGEPLSGLAPVNLSGSVVDCENEPGVIIHDDGTIENGYSADPANVSSTAFVDRFGPSVYPAAFRAVCVTFLSQGPAAMDFEIVFFADDGLEGSPGTELGAMLVSAANIPVVPPLLPTPLWFSYDVSSLGIVIEDGSVYIGVRWSPSDPNVFIGADQSTDRPPGFAGGYWWVDALDEWAPIESGYENYRALFVRAVEDLSGCHDPGTIPWLSIIPDQAVTPTGASTIVTVTADTTGLNPGEYRASLCVNTNDAHNPLVVVPVNLTIPGGNLGEIFRDRFEAGEDQP